MEKQEFKPTIKQLDNMAHALGITLYDALVNPRKEYKSLPSSFYRNYFQVADDEKWNVLCENGYAERSVNSAHGLNYYYVSEKGISYLREFFMNNIAYRTPANRNLDYLKVRITLYCEWMYYKFGSDNSRHIICEYVNKYSKKIYVSHTTGDVIKRFLSELKWYKKQGLIDEYIQ